MKFPDRSYGRKKKKTKDSMEGSYVHKGKGPTAFYELNGRDNKHCILPSMDCFG